MKEKGAVPILALLALAALGVLVYKSISPPPPPQSLTTSQAQVISSPKPQAKALDQARLEKYLTVESALLGVSDNLSLYFKDLSLNQEVGIEPTRSWIPASTIKAYVAVEVFRQRNIGLINFNTPITITAANVVPTELETDDYPRLREGTTATIKQLVEAMVVQSDNTAYNSLLDILDRRNINTTLKNFGLTETVVGEKLNLDESQFQTDLTTPGRQPNTTTAKDLASLFELLYKKQIPSSDEILAVFERQKINNMIPALLPPGTLIAHKTGDWAPIFHDGGVVFKTNNPYILTVFTSSGDPMDVAQLSKVAYYQNADSVIGRQSPSKKQSLNLIPSERLDIISLAPSSNNVLAEENAKFPTITAADLGITPQDLGTSVAKGPTVSNALITPGNLLFPFKQWWENERLKLAPNNHNKVGVLVSRSRDSLAEVKSLLSEGNIALAQQTLASSEKDLEQATTLAKNDPDKDELLLQVKQVNDLHFSVLADKANSINSSQKERYIDSVYAFYKQNHQAVAKVVQTSTVANPTQQKPAVGQITDIGGGKATLTFDDGTKKEVVLTDNTRVRQFGQSSYDSGSSLHQGDKIAIIGVTNANNQIVPQFVLKSLPKELPDSHVGTVIEINGPAKQIKILDKNGQLEVVKAGQGTTIRSTDTDVSLTGIKAGSQVTVFGTVTKASAPSSLNPSVTPGGSFNPSPVAQPSAASKQGSTNRTVPGLSGQPAAPGAKPNQSSNEIHATSITVTKNSSGSQEKHQEQPKNNSSKDSGKKGK